jgi:uncharacterized membrane protein YfcA
MREPNTLGTTYLPVRNTHVSYSMGSPCHCWQHQLPGGVLVAAGCSQAVGAPIGAALLTNLEPRAVEFAMACVLLLVICLQFQGGQGAHSCCQRTR